MAKIKLTVLSLRYSSWSMRPWLVLTHAGAVFETKTVALAEMHSSPDDKGEINKPTDKTPLAERRQLGSVRGLFPVLRVDGVAIHESLAICEYVADIFPAISLWPDDVTKRAQARAICCEMLSGFNSLRSELSCHLFARAPQFQPSAAASTDVARVFEIWSECLDRSGGPFLFEKFGIADAMYYPVLTRFRTYGIGLPKPLSSYAEHVDSQPAVKKLIEKAASEPHIPIYDDYIRKFGGDPNAAQSR